MASRSMLGLRTRMSVRLTSVTYARGVIIRLNGAKTRTIVASLTITTCITIAHAKMFINLLQNATFINFHLGHMQINIQYILTLGFPRYAPVPANTWATWTQTVKCYVVAGPPPRGARGPGGVVAPLVASNELRDDELNIRRTESVRVRN